MLKAMSELQKHHNIQLKKDEFTSLDKLKVVIKKLLSIILLAEPILSHNLLSPDTYNDENEDYQLTKDFHQTFKNSDDGFDDLKANELIRLISLLQYIFNQLSSTKYKITPVDFLELKPNKISGILIRLSQLAKFIKMLNDEIEQILQELDGQKQKQNEVLKEINNREIIFIKNNMDLDSLSRDLDNLAIKIDETNKENSDLENQCLAIKRENEKLKTENKSNESVLTKMKEEGEKLRSSIEELINLTQYDKEEAEKKLRELHDQYKVHEVNYLKGINIRSDLQFRLENTESLQMQMKYYHDKINLILQHKEKHQGCKTQLSKLSQTYEDDINRLKSRMNCLKSTIDSKEQKVANYNEKIYKKDEELQSKKESNQALQNEIETKRRKICSLKKQIEAVKQQSVEERKKQIEMDKTYKENIENLKETFESSLKEITENYSRLTK